MIFDGEPGLEIDEDESYWEPRGAGLGHVRRLRYHTAWMSQEVSKLLISGLSPQYTPFIRLYK